ncbi:glycoside hydrolase [Paucibacter oligotrophus]|uniref:Glycoside hydrolase n=2 Tax=Roseateles oligotrophus TaxID=1769250 RepID=A0ABT2YLD3_9BURK|nr:glycoside hydrolase [Roseateles oligotrophus]
MRLSKALFTPIALAAMLSTAQAQVITVGQNINVTKQSGSQSETAIAISRINSNLVTISSNGGGNMINKFSANGGASWANSAYAVPGGYDSGMAADSFGNIFLSYQVNQQTHVARSTDGGATYGFHAAIAGGGADHPEMAVGPGRVAGTTDLMFRDSVNGQSRIVNASSSGFGSTGAFTTQTNQGAGNFGSTAIGNNGRAAFTVMTSAGTAGPDNLTVRYDADGLGAGASFVNGATIVTQVGGWRPIPAQPSRTIDTQVSLQFDSSGGVHNNDLYMLYTQAANPTTNDTNIVIRRSSDNGATFSSEVRLNDDLGSNSQFFGRLAVDQTTGYLASVWYDARNSVGNNMVEVWGTVSMDGGTTWAKNFKISQGMSDGRTSNINNGNEFGDYIALDFYAGNLVTAWADSSNSTGDNPDLTKGLDIYYARATVAVPEPSTLLLTSLGLLFFFARRVKRS